MIELRWLKIDDPNRLQGGDGDFLMPAKTMTLQFRINKHSLHRALEGWTEWQDVPVVSE